MKARIKLAVTKAAASMPAARMSSLFTGAGLALATAGAHAGGLESGTAAVTMFQTWLYSLAAILAVCYLLWVGLQCWSNKADWVHDFGGAIAKVAAVGAVIVLAPWAWTLFTG
jgi:hypothetical protein